jgi:hypothetical protein
MKHGTIDFDEVLSKIKKEIERLEGGMCVYDFAPLENEFTYHKLKSIFEMLKEIKSR